MEKLIATPTTIKDTDQTNEIITRIVNLVTIQQIYCTTILNHDNLLTELIILISNNCSKTLIEIVPLIDMVFEDYPDYCYRLYHVHQAKDSIKKGNLFFYNVCSAENLCYTDSTLDLNLFAEVSGLEKLLDEAKMAFNKEIAKIQAFNEGADFYLKKENLALTAFMVHQQIELAYRAVELFAMGKDKVTHSIRVHQKHVGPYLPVLGALFDESNDFENKLMQQLDDAYLMVRYGDNYEINKDKLLKAMEKGEQVQEMVGGIYGKMINDFEQKLLNSKVEPTIDTAKDIVAEENETWKANKNRFLLSQDDLDIVHTITKHLDVELIYCINRISTSSTLEGMLQKDAVEHFSRHFLLLVITKKSCDKGSFNVQNIVNQSKGISATVTLLVHSIKNVNEALIDNNRFFHEALRSNQLIYQNGPVLGLIELPKYDSSKEFQRPDFVWRHRKRRAEVFLAAVANMGEYETEVVEISLLNQAVEQLCLGFIFVSMGYKSNQKSLKHLANICRCITPKFNEAIPIDTEDDKCVFEALVDAIKDTRYRIPYTIDPTDVKLLYQRCRAWMEKADKLVNYLIRHPL